MYSVYGLSNPLILSWFTGAVHKALYIHNVYTIYIYISIRGVQVYARSETRARSLLIYQLWCITQQNLTKRRIQTPLRHNKKKTRNENEKNRNNFPLTVFIWLQEPLKFVMHFDSRSISSQSNIYIIICMFEAAQHI